MAPTSSLVSIENSESLIRAADRAVYRAKGAGKSQIVAATEASNTTAI